MMSTPGVDNIDTSFKGGVGDMGKRHPSDRERQQATLLFTLMKERMPSWKLKRSVKWKGQDEGRILIIATPGDTFSPDPNKSDRFERDYKSCHTDYGFRLNILMPSSSCQHFDASLEIVGLAKNSDKKEHSVCKVTPAQFLSYTGCSYGFDVVQKQLKFHESTNLSEVVDSVCALLKNELEEMATLLVFDHFSQPEAIISNDHQVQEFVTDLIRNGFKEKPEWLEMPLNPDYRFSMVGVCFDTIFKGVQGGQGHCMKFQNEVVLRGYVRLYWNDSWDKLIIRVGATPSFFDSCQDDRSEKSHIVSKVTSKEGLERLMLELMEEVVFDTYRRSQGWSRPVIWKTTTSPR